MAEIKTIGVLSSGGDAPGMNAVIRAVVRAGLHYGLKVKGIRKGYNGLIEGDIFEMGHRSVADILNRGGTILQTARSAEFSTEAGIKKAYMMTKIFEIDGIIVIGGDGSFRGAKDISLAGVPAIGIPATIDNDVSSSEYAIGFDTALNTVKDAIDKIRDTATSHERCSIIEVMGKAAGHIAINVGIANGAEAIIIPEKEFDFHTDIVKHIIAGKHKGKKHYIIILAEGVGGAAELAKRIEKKTGIETRETILGHLQRGGSPTVRDRVIGSKMGLAAVKLLRDGIGDRVIAMQDNKIIDIDIQEALNMKKGIDESMLELAEILSF